jgi:hypothetical protein
MQLLGRYKSTNFRVTLRNSLPQKQSYHNFLGVAGSMPQRLSRVGQVCVSSTVAHTNQL